MQLVCLDKLNEVLKAKDLNLTAQVVTYTYLNESLKEGQHILIVAREIVSEIKYGYGSGTKVLHYMEQG
jgi:hypothetical protein